MSDLDSKFIEYHQANPLVFSLMVRFTEEARKRGFKNFGAKAVFERIRWFMHIETKDEQEFKLNNNYTSRYVRLLEKVYPEYAGFYRTRELRS